MARTIVACACTLLVLAALVAGALFVARPHASLPPSLPCSLCFNQLGPILTAMIHYVAAILVRTAPPRG